MIVEVMMVVAVVVAHTMTVLVETTIADVATQAEEVGAYSDAEAVGATAVTVKEDAAVTVIGAVTIMESIASATGDVSVAILEREKEEEVETEEEKEEKEEKELEVEREEAKRTMRTKTIGNGTNLILIWKDLVKNSTAK